MAEVVQSNDFSYENYPTAARREHCTDSMNNHNRGLSEVFVWEFSLSGHETNYK